MHDSSWFLAQCRPNATRMARENLERQGFGTFLPLVRETRRRGGRFVTEVRPLFGSYLFFSVGAGAAPWHKLRSTRGISRVVSTGETPQRVDPGLIEALAARCDAEGCLRPEAEIAPGDRVVLTEGPFAEFAATVVDMAPDRRVWVLLDLMGQQTRIAVGRDQLRGV